MTNINIKVKTGQAIRALNNIRNEVDEVTAKAINRVALDAQEAVREHIAREFILRRKSFIDRSIKIKPFAKPSKLSATLAVDPPGGEKNDVLSKFEFGGDKQAQGGNLAIPTTDVRKNVRNIVRARNKPRNMKRTFVMKTKSGRKVIARRKNKKQLVFPWVLLPSVPITKKLDLVKITNEVVAKNFSDKWTKEWRKAVERRFV